MNTSPTTTDALQAIRGLSREEVEARISELETELAALRPIWRSLVARENAKARRKPPKVEAAPCS